MKYKKIITEILKLKFYIKAMNRYEIFEEMLQRLEFSLCFMEEIKD